MDTVLRGAAGTGTVQARVSRKLKEEAENVLSAMGMTTSGAINVFLQAVVNYRKIPFEISLPEDIPNEMTRRAIEEGRAGKGKTFNSTEELYADLGI